jgi:hypothetical protein
MIHISLSIAFLHTWRVTALIFLTIMSTVSSGWVKAWMRAVSLLLNLGAAKQGRSVMFSDEQKLLFEGWKKGFVMNTKSGFYEMLTKPRMRVI